ncbi:hypothetical protein FRB90_000164 [Tulasnella sp. 427]|nr:hypothetical protein FRB90_000164 [Tulasnella sp. 427]
MSLSDRQALSQAQGEAKSAYAATNGGTSHFPPDVYAAVLPVLTNGYNDDFTAPPTHDEDGADLTDLLFGGPDPRIPGSEGTHPSRAPATFLMQKSSNPPPSHGYLKSLSSDSSSLKEGFPRKLYRLMQDSDAEEVISWSEDGTQIVIPNRTALEQSGILQRYFGHNKAGSLLRQLGNYNFKKVGDRAKPHQADELSDVYYHPDFCDGNEELLDQVKPKSKRLDLADSTFPRIQAHPLVAGRSAAQASGAMDILVVRLARELDEMKQTLGEVAREMDEVKRKLREAEAKDKHWALENTKLRRDMRQLQMSLGQTKSSFSGRLMQDIPPTSSSTGQDRSSSLGAPVTRSQVSHHRSDIDNNPRLHGTTDVQGAQHPLGAALHDNSYPASSLSETIPLSHIDPRYLTLSFNPAPSHVGSQHLGTLQTLHGHDPMAGQNTVPTQPAHLTPVISLGPPGGIPPNEEQIAGPSNFPQNQHRPQAAPQSRPPHRSIPVMFTPLPSAAGAGNHLPQAPPGGYGSTRPWNG